MQRRRHWRRVGAPRTRFRAPTGFAHPTDSETPTLPRRGKSAEYFPQNHGGWVFRRTARRHAFAAKKPCLAARKNCAHSVASSLPQDSQVESVFAAARFDEPALSASRSFRFHIARRRNGSPQRLGTPHKWFNRQWIFDATRFLAAPRDLNACSAAVFCKHRCTRGRGLPSVAARRLKFCRKSRAFERGSPDFRA